MGAAPLKGHHNLNDLHDWMKEKGISSLFSISEWNQDRWAAWKRPALPSCLADQWEELKALLYGSPPINKQNKDTYIWDPSGGDYSIKSGYNFLYNYSNFEKWNLWTVVWKNVCLPKVKFFV